MVLNIISVGNKLTPWESQGIEYYQKQLSKNISLNFIDIKGQQHPKRSEVEGFGQQAGSERNCVTSGQKSHLQVNFFSAVGRGNGAASDVRNGL